MGILSPREVELLKRYVQEGGKLLVTGQTGQFGARGNPLDETVLADLIGARVKERLDTEDNWISLTAPSDLPAPTGKRLSAGLRLDWPFLVKGPATVYEPTTAKPNGYLHKPHRTNRQLEGKMGTDWPMSADGPVGPAILLNRFGKGTVVTCTASPDYASASEHAIVEDRILFRNAFDALIPRRRVEITAPANVEAVVTDDPESRTLRVHFLAYNPTPRTTPQGNRPFVLPGMIEDEPIFRVSCTFREPPQACEALNPNTELHQSGSKIEATIESIHEVLILRY